MKESGRLIYMRTIGWFTNDDDESFLLRYFEKETKFIREQNSLGLEFPSSSEDQMDWTPGYPSASSSEPYPNRTVVIEDDSVQIVPSDDNRARRAPVRTYEPQPVDIERDHLPFSGLKQKIMAFLFRKAFINQSEISLQNYHSTFGHFVSLAMWRMQFLDENHIIVKFGHLDNVIGRNPEPSAAQASFFVIFSLLTSQVISIHENCSEELLDAFQRWDIFRGVPFDDPVHFVSSPCNNEFARDVVQRQMYGVRKARNGGGSAAIKRILSALPFNPQSYMDSPYFDHALYSYDDKVINSCDRQRPCIDFPIKFHGREFGDLKFKIDPNPPPNVSTGRG
ncbi:acid phosphatase det1, partial [Nowakowskiella sp. JEL0078]